MQTRQLKVLVVAPEEVVVEADPARIRQALENLISNALKHPPDGVPVEVEVTHEKSDDTCTPVKLMVSPAIVDIRALAGTPALVRCASSAYI
jgi:signal transduction histidine kinase